MIALLAGLALLLAAVWWLRREWTIDACLDAGGRWDAPAASCVGARPEG